ncbi:MAG: PilN domain-containing protein [Rhodoferax sp.]
MILINLLPHREAARKQRRDAFFASLGAAALIGGLLSGGIYLWYQAQISSQESKNHYLQTENKRLDGQIKDIAGLQTEIAGLRARQQAVEDLQSDRNMPVNLLNELAKQLPDGVYVTSMVQDKQKVTLKGVAQSNERVSELLRNLANNSPWLDHPELVEIVAGTVTLSPRDQRRVSNFTLTVTLKRPTDNAKPAAGAGGAAPNPAASAQARAKP